MATHSHPPIDPSNDAITQLNLIITSLVNPQDSRSYSFNAFVKNRIRQFNLTGHLCPTEVIIEAYTRGIAAIAAEKEVKNWQAWLRSVCLNIIREKSRERIKCSPADPQSLTLSNIEAGQALSTYNTDREIDRVNQITHCLRVLDKAYKLFSHSDPEGARLLELKLCQGWSWEQIRAHLVSEQGEDSAPSLAALRQRASRAKRKVRRLYHQIDEKCSELPVR